MLLKYTYCIVLLLYCSVQHCLHVHVLQNFYQQGLNKLFYRLNP